MFEKASRLKVRFDSPKGLLSIEDLWDIPLSSNTGKVNLDAIAIDLHHQLKSGDDISFVNKENKSDAMIQLKFDIVKHIIEVRLVENEAAALARSNKEKKQQILSIIAQKENEQLAGSSLEDLKKLADSL
jgi:hypothetical protein